jgi:hypothetical protein
VNGSAWEGPEAMERELTGIVIPGRGLGSVRMARSDTVDRMEELVGFPLVPGTPPISIRWTLTRSSAAPAKEKRRGSASISAQA